MLNQVWSILYCPIPNSYLLMLWANDKAYQLPISRELAETLNDEVLTSHLYEGHIEKETAKEIGEFILNDIIQSTSTPDNVIVVDKQCLKDHIKKQYGVDLEEKK